MHRTTGVVGALVAVAALAVSSGVMAAGPRRGAHDAWRVVNQVSRTPEPTPSSFTAVVALTPTDAWAFETTASRAAPIVAWRLHGSTWTTVAFPEAYGSSVVAASGARPSSVWAATSRGALLTWSGGSWKLVRRFVAIGDIDATGAGDLWVLGRVTHARATGGLWHLDRGAWTHPTDRGYGVIDAAADDAIYSVTSTSLEEFDGIGWRATSLASLLPPKEPLCQEPGLTSVLALSPTDVWVTAAGNCQDFSGPFRLLHSAGSAWTVAAALDRARGFAVPAGDGGLWIPTKAFACIGCTQMLHLAAGHITQVSLPLTGRGEPGVTIVAGTTPPGTTASFAVGWTLRGNDFNHMQGVVLRYGP